MGITEKIDEFKGMSDIQKRIVYVDLIARVMIMAAIIFIGYGIVVNQLQDRAIGNSIMFTGLIFVALFGVSAYVKKHLQKQTEVGRTFHQNH